MLLYHAIKTVYPTYLDALSTPQTVEPTSSTNIESSVVPAMSAPAAATDVKPAAEIAEPTVPSTPSSTDEVPVPQEGWGFTSYFFFFAFIGGVGFLLWWMGATRFVMRILKQNGGKYRRVDDLEK